MDEPDTVYAGYGRGAPDGRRGGLRDGAPKKTQMQRMAGKAKRAVSDAAENVSNMMS